jgi:hypothetical protein
MLLSYKIRNGEILYEAKSKYGSWWERNVNSSIDWPPRMFRAAIARHEGGNLSTE